MDSQPTCFNLVILFLKLLFVVLFVFVNQCVATTNENDCPAACTREFDPVCGKSISTDEKLTFPNLCVMEGVNRCDKKGILMCYHIFTRTFNQIEKISLFF